MTRMKWWQLWVLQVGCCLISVIGTFFVGVVLLISGAIDLTSPMTSVSEVMFWNVSVLIMFAIMWSLLWCTTVMAQHPSLIASFGIVVVALLITVVIVTIDFFVLGSSALLQHPLAQLLFTLGLAPLFVATIAYRLQL